jgi:hypothetical protein
MRTILNDENTRHIDWYEFNTGALGIIEHNTFERFHTNESVMQKKRNTDRAYWFDRLRWLRYTAQLGSLITQHTHFLASYAS